MRKYIYDAVLTPEEGGGYSVEVPALPRCFTCGDDYRDAVFMAADAMKTWLAAALADGRAIPPYERAEAPEGCERVSVFVEADESHIVDGSVVSAAQAARELGVSAGRVTHMLDSGILDGYRSGRRTYVTEASIAARKAAPPESRQAEGAARCDGGVKPMPRLPVAVQGGISVAFVRVDGERIADGHKIHARPGMVAVLRLRNAYDHQAVPAL